jgi:hypothetical protein
MTTNGTWANLMRWIGVAHRRQRAKTPDFADHGTAFGLELSMAHEDIAPRVHVQAQARSNNKAGLAHRLGRVGR